MPITPGHFTLSPEQRQFKKLLNDFPRLASFWNFENRDCNLQALEKAIPTMSHGEQIMAKFFVAVWLGENQFDFDMIDAAASLDDTHRQLIINWLSNPVFP